MTNQAPPPSDPIGRHSTAVVVLAALAGFALGAIAAFAVTGLVFRVRVELPPPPYPSVLSTPPAAVPAPPLPPGPPR
ncbi:hypothetical protein [Mycobacterium sp. Marseille-P9652]|uniref:hypothetical protein n=1 Tax=Mycobacterium sp. Marseille-P9652 TaxID=2654950 RepID=UPI0012E87D4A|nr:hypothetical protein [Mycobacterium sp. Marseille-P9652]